MSVARRYCIAMIVRIKTYCTGKYGRGGEKIVKLNSPVFFSNGNLNKTASLKGGYKELEVVRQPYGFGLKVEAISEIISQEEDK